MYKFCLGIKKKDSFFQNTADRNLNWYFLEDKLIINIIFDVVILCMLIYSKEIILEIFIGLTINVLISDCVHYSKRQKAQKWPITGKSLKKLFIIKSIISHFLKYIMA